MRTKNQTGDTMELASHVKELTTYYKGNEQRFCQGSDRLY